MLVQTILDFCTSNGYTAISDVRVNTNGYPYMTFLNGSDTQLSENYYFSIEQSKKVSKGDKPTVLRGLKIGEVENAKGEKRFKIGSFTSENYTSLESIFG